jgi:hypothetical protein
MNYDAEHKRHKLDTLLSLVIDGLWMDKETERECVAAGIDPNELRQACRERLEAIASGQLCES